MPKEKQKEEKTDEQPKEEVKKSKEETEEPKEEPKAEETKEQPVEGRKQTRPQFEIPEGWKPKTILGKKVLAGEITDIGEVFAKGIKIAEPPIVDILLPNLEKDVIFVGGSTGKGGGIRRTPFRRTSRMHKSGRRYRMTVMAIVGNRNGYVGVGLAASPPGKHQEAIAKATNKAKLNIIPIARGCGSWECLCETHHSIPFTVGGKTGSSMVKLMPAPKGIGLAVSNEIKKVMSLAGISDIWCRSRGNTKMRINFVKAIFSALKKLNVYKLKPEFEQKVGMKVGKVE